MVQVVLANELTLPSTPLPAVCISLSRKERNCFITLATSRLTALSSAFSVDFDSLGRPSQAVSVTLGGSHAIRVEAETGFVP